MTFIPDWKIADDCWPVLALAGIVTILTSIIFLPLGCFFLGIMMWLAHGLRVPNRQTKADDQIIYAPADGVVLDIETDQFPDVLAGDNVTPAKRITIHSRLTDTQLQTSPITGHIVDNLLLPGLFRKWGYDRISWQAARLSNERREIRIRDASDREIMLVQLGSKTARQLICRLAEGKFVHVGAPIGMARIAGVVDVFVPAGCKLLIDTGQHVIAGETAIAKFALRRSAKRS